MGRSFRSPQGSSVLVRISSLPEHASLVAADSIWLIFDLSLHRVLIKQDLQLRNLGGWKVSNPSLSLLYSIEAKQFTLYEVIQEIAIEKFVVAKDHEGFSCRHLLSPGKFGLVSAIKL